MKHYEYPPIFINYRRAVSLNEVNTLDAELRGRYGEQAVFRDNRSLEAGCRWEKTLEDAINHCEVLLVVIGKGWLECQYDENCDPANGEKRGVQKLCNPNDYVRKEIEWALQRQSETGKPAILPVFFDGCKPYKKSEYPDDTRLHELAAIQSRFEIDTKKNIPEQLAPLFAELESLAPQLTPQHKAKKPQNEYPELLERFFPLPGDIRLNPPANAAPYMDLTWFKAENARLFFGRSEKTYHACQAIHSSNTRLLLLHGLSGVGKSSLLDAGVKPRLERLDWRVLHGRRGDRAGGLCEVLAALEKKAVKQADRLLFILDQVEEAITHPLVSLALPKLAHSSDDSDSTDELNKPAAATAETGELQAFCKALHRLLHKHPEAKCILGFRKEYLPEVKDALAKALVYRDFGDKGGIAEIFLQPLDKEGILEAIQGAWLDDDLRKNHFHDFSFEPEDLPEIIAQDIAKDSGSNIAPLLQVQMLDLWKEALKMPGVPVLSEQLLKHTRYENLEHFLEKQLGKLPEKFRNEHWLGLALDLLHFFTTDKGTAAIHRPETIAEQYGHQPEYDALIHALTDLYLLIDNRKDENRPYVRLAHDALGPIVLAKFDKREYPSQRAWFITRSKSSGFSEADALLANATRPFIRKTDDAIWAEIENDMAELERKEVRERENKAFIFNSLLREFEARVDQTDYVAALESFQAAFRHDPDKKELLVPGIEEAVFFFTEAGNPAKAGEALKALGDTRPDLEPQIRSFLDKRASDCNELRQCLRLLYGNTSYDAWLEKFYPAMIPVEGGEFTMGDGSDTDNPAHTVRLRSFKLGRTPVTVRQFALYCACHPDASPLREYHPYWGLHGDHPIVSASWYNAIEYLNWLSLAKGKTPVYDIDKTKKDPNNLQQQDWLRWTVNIRQDADGFRLPTEAEWDFAARGGLKGIKDKFKFSGSKDDLNEVGWYKDNSGAQAQPVAHPSKKHNQLGLYDMSGNVWEWCWDWYAEDHYKNSAPENPLGPEKGNMRVFRGGSWYNTHLICRVAYRYRNNPVIRYNSVGFRTAQD